MAATNFLGVGSGLPFDQWMADERKGLSQKLNPYLQKQSSYKGQISAWGSISSSLSTLKDNLSKLEDEGFNGVSVSDNKTFKATAGRARSRTATPLPLNSWRKRISLRLRTTHAINPLVAAVRK